MTRIPASGNVAWKDVWPTAAELMSGARLVIQGPLLLRNPLTPYEANQLLQRRLKNRDANFLSVMRDAVYAQATSPIRRLLELTGCQLGDIEQLVHQHGIEGTLRILYRDGVYLTLDEFRGRVPIVRGGSSFESSPELLKNPLVRQQFRRSTGGSRGTSLSAELDLALERHRQSIHLLALDARGRHARRIALWKSYDAGMSGLLIRALSAVSCDRWFCTTLPTGDRIPPRYVWSSRVLRLVGLLGGVQIPRPEPATLNDPDPIVDWMFQTLCNGETPHLDTTTSAATKVCQAALRRGVDLRGAEFMVGGEPFTATRRQALVSTGATVVSHYGATESPSMGMGCLAPQEPDEVHHPHDWSAIIQPDALGPARGLPPDALLITTLSPHARLVLVNTSLGDYAKMTQRACGCPLEALGWHTHLHTIRSFEKLTAAGATFHDADIVRVLDEVLPSRYGGGPTHYQLVESESEEGNPRVTLLVDPAVGYVDEQSVANTFLEEIGQGVSGHHLMALTWRDGDVLRVERRTPFATPAGKILHLHAARSPRTS